MSTKILITWYSKALGGAEDSVIALCNYLSDYRDLEIVLLCVTSFQASFNPKNKLNKKVKLYHFSFPLFLYNILAFFVVSWICLKEKVDIVNVNYRAVLSESLAAKVLGKKVISTIRAVLIDKTNVRPFRYTNMMVAISKAVTERIKELGYKNSVRVIYNGIDLKNFKIWIQKPLKSRTGFYFMARLVKWKRPDWFVKAAVEVHKEYPDSKFVLFGKGNEEDIKEIIRKNNAGDYIKLGGFISQNDPQLKEYGICVLPSFVEPFGKTIIEAVLRNNVVVGTNSGGIPELLKGYDLLFERDSLTDLIDKMKKAYCNFDRYYSLISTMREDFRKQFNMERVVKDYYSLFRSL